MDERMSLKEASKTLGMAELQIRILMQRNKLDIGIAIPPDEKHRNWSYYIYRKKVNRLVGIE